MESIITLNEVQYRLIWMLLKYVKIGYVEDGGIRHVW
jgi:hypothetical protein